MSHSRRDFLVRTTCATLGAAAFQGTVRQFGLANLLATPNAVTGNYRALVCIYLNGGSDSNNMIIPTTTADYNMYAASRPGLNIPLSSVVPFANGPASTPGQTFGVHPNMPDIKDLYNANKLAVVTNVGPLVKPLTQAEYIAGGPTNPKPYALFSHSDQVQAWESGRADIKVSTGWGGRAADAVADCNANAGGFPTITSIAGSSTFCIGLKRPLSIGTGSLTSVLVLNGFSGSATDLARRSSMDYLRTIDTAASTMNAAASATTQQAIDISADFSSDPTINTVFPNTGLANQLKQVAKVIKLVQNAPGLTLSRQIFFVSQGGYDTHQNQLNDQGNNFTDLSAAMLAFYNATVELGLQNNVTTFTLSDFGRTLQPSGSGGSIGSDHGWGSHQLVMGDAVAGNNFYGTPNQNGLIFPTLTPGSIDDTTNNTNNGRGRWIPTSGSDQYGATLAKWFGVSDLDMGSVFPNKDNFPTMDLGFMGAPPAGC